MRRPCVRCGVVRQGLGSRSESEFRALARRPFRTRDGLGGMLPRSETGKSLAAMAFSPTHALDALTTFEMGIAFFSPLTCERYVSSWRPIDSRSAEFWFVLAPCVLFTCVALRMGGIGLRWSSRESPVGIRIE